MSDDLKKLGAALAAEEARKAAEEAGVEIVESEDNPQEQSEVVASTPLPAAPASKRNPLTPNKRPRGRSGGKSAKSAAAVFSREELYAPKEAIGIVRTLATAKFDETVDVAFKLGVDARKDDQRLRGTVSLPAGTGKTIRVAVFAAGDAAEAAREAGADVVGSDDLVSKVQGGFLDFDIAIATPDQMPQVGQLGRVLGPRGLMPNPKTGTVTNDVGKAVADFKGGRVEYKTDRFANVHVLIGKASFAPEALLENFNAVVDELTRAKPASAKGKYVRAITVSSTQGPGVKVDTGRLKPEVEE